MAVLVTGAAGFIGMHVAEALLRRGEEVVGLDNLNDYYDVSLKDDRLSLLRNHPAFSFVRADLGEEGALEAGLAGRVIDRVVHLAAQAGVRYSIQNPRSYAASNLTGHLEVLEYCRHNGGLKHLVYASSSSVYGGNKKVPFSEDDRVDAPVSLYAATKKADELMSHTYAHLYGLPQTGLRFFTVYGPWGRPDMAYFSFTKNIMEGKPIRVFNHGKMRRDFTYIDDIVAGVVAALDNPPEAAEESPPHRVFNLGNNKPVALMDFITTLEGLIGKKSEWIYEPMQDGDVVETYADIERAKAALGYAPATDIEEGLSRFVSWYTDYSSRE
ncbi:NAD-dependent epimerase [Tepidicaulis sp.]|uniref:NAD-dependent epimerase n=1 Tax=Tepidicaulis sp. TaxID=1920809 RepID=UPI003B5A6909